MGLTLSRKARTGKLRAAANAAGFEMLESRALLSAWFVSPMGNDSGAGTIDAPFKSIQYALDKAAAGDTINLRAGQYAAGVTVRTPNITLQGYQNEVAKIAGSPTSGPDVALRVDLDAQNVTLRNLDISGGYYYTLKTESNWDYEFPTRAARGLTIDNCRIHDSGRDAIKIVPGTDNVTIRNSEIYNTGMRDSSNADGIDAVNADNFVLQDSYIHHTATDGVYVKGGSTGTIIERNRVSDIGWSGIILGQDSDYEWFDRSVNPSLYENIDGVVRNNVVTNTGAAGVSLWGALRPQVYNNTIVGASSKGMQGGIYVTGIEHYPPPDYSTPVNRTNTDVKIANNIVVMGGARPAVLIQPNSVDGGFSISNNVYYRPGGSATFTDGRTGFSGGFAAWQSHIGDAGSKEADPKLDSANRLMAGSPAIDAGKTISSFSSDYDKKARPAGAAWDIGAFEYNSTTTAPPPTTDPTTPPPTTDPTPPPPTTDPTPTPTWDNASFASQTGKFQAVFTAKPTALNSNVLVGFSQGAADWVTDLGPIVRFNEQNRIDARNGGDYAALASVSYAANASYQFRVVVDMATHTYDAYVTPQGGSEVAIAKGYAFRTEQAAVSSLDNRAKYNLAGDATVSGFTVGAVPTTPPPTETPPPTTVSGWANQPIAAQSGKFQVEFDAKATQLGSDVAIGLSQGAADWFTDLGPIVRFNSGNRIDARNGGDYAALASVGYVAGANYHFRMVVDLASRTYDVYVTPQGGGEVALAQGYAFRSDQPVTTALDNIARYNEAGNVTLANVTAGAVLPTPPAQSVWVNQPIAKQTAPFTVEFDAKPAQAGSDVVIGLSQGAADWYSDLGPIVRFNSENRIDARNGGAYAAASSVGYAPNATYHFRMVVDPAKRTYDAYVTPQGGTEVLLGRGYAFRSDQVATASLDNLAMYNLAGAATLSNVKVAAQAAATGTGLKAEYFNNADLTAPVATRTDARVDFNWGNGAPIAGMGVDTFSARWTGQIQPRYSELYTFHAKSDDGVRVWVNNQLIVDSWSTRRLAESTGKIRLEAGQKYDIRVEYFDSTGFAMVQLLWSSASQPKEIIPPSRLYAPAAATAQYFDDLAALA